jgi:hypothetical protein
VADWTRQTPEALQAWRDRLAALREDERGEIICLQADEAATQYAECPLTAEDGPRERSDRGRVRMAEAHAVFDVPL